MKTDKELGTEVIETVNAWWAAWIRGDAKAVADLSHPYFDTLSDRHQFRGLGRDRLYYDVRECFAECEIDYWVLTSQLVSRWGDVLVCYYRFEVHGDRGPRSFRALGRATDVIIRTASGLQVFSHQGEIVDITERFRAGVSATVKSWDLSSRAVSPQAPLSP